MQRRIQGTLDPNKRTGLILFSFLLAASMIAGLSSGAFAWEGRMAGMGDPYGLISDESDFLTLPTKIVDGNGTGVKYYWDARFAYHDVSDLNWSGNLSGPISILGNSTNAVSADGSWNSSGDMWDYSTQLGATLPAGAGRLGFFFKYTGQRADYDGDQTLSGSIEGLGSASVLSSYNMTGDSDSFNLRVIYGQPLGCDLRIGGEIQVGYVQETNKYHNNLGSYSLMDNNGSPLTGLPALTLEMENGFIGELFPFMKPYDDNYWEALFKLGIDGNFGPSWIGMDVRGGPLFGGDNTWKQSIDASAALGGTTYSASEAYRLKGDVSGWKLGGDFWLRYPVSQTLSIPFSVRVDYLDKTRDGTGTGALAASNGVSTLTSEGFGWGYQNEEKKLSVEAGGGVEKQVSPDLKVAVGLYYDFIYNEESLGLALDTGYELLGESLIVSYDNDKLPNLTEHLVKMKFMAEQKRGTWTLRGGLSAFGGPVTEDYSSTLGTPSLGGINVLRNKGSLDGTTWGITGSIGATTRIAGAVVEPFIQAGYQELDLSGSGSTSVLGSVVDIPWNLDKNTSEAIVGAGFSITF